VIRLLIFVHRWLGVALSLIFTIWFLSGIVMMYWSYPEISAGDRLQRAQRLDPAQITISPEQAFAALERAPDSGPVRLGSFDGRPVYRFSGGGGRSVGAAMVYADDGSVQRVVDAAMMDRAAAAWAGRPRSDATKRPVEDVDQWTVGSLRNVRPLFKYSWPDGQQVYVNGNTGDVVQYTTTSSRFWAYLGAIPHWLYFTPLRKHQPEWFSFVIWLSLIGTIAALMGLAIILWMYSPRKRYRFAGAPTSIPYRGWKRWHAITGLFFGIVTTTWAFSGLLSMGPFPIMNRLTDLTVPASDGSVGRGPNVANALRGGRAQPLSAYAGRSPRDAIAAVPDFDVKELVWTSFAGEPLYLATNGRGETRLIPMDDDPRLTIDPEDVMRVVRAALGENLGELRVVDEYDAYYLDRRGDRPLPVVYARLNDAVATRYYIDPKTATVVGQYSARGWVNRWLYHGLHSLDFPWLYRYRPLWDIVVIGLMLGGTALCLTSLVMTWRVLARKMAVVIRARIDLPDEDLAT
jgi:PepSY-associated TM region